ncbi:hypothetical protein [Geobacter pickeringii]|uniref:hypothetical protein n=1 Tax=Geobacter pickeringii TaxID=345632 RepID=UPI00069022F4|nr:hypothetical protein [Geobacter pickeringii]
MSASVLRWLAAGAAGLLVSCAFITVNVYFPEKEVKKAFKTLDDKFLKPGEEPKQGEAPAPAEPPSPATPQPPPPDKPQSSLRDGGGWRRWGTATAWAADDVSASLVTELSRMPEVMEASDDFTRM